MDTADKLLVSSYQGYLLLVGTADDQVVGTADRKIHVVDLNNPGTIYRVSLSPIHSTVSKLMIDYRFPLKVADEIYRLFPFR